MVKKTQKRSDNARSDNHQGSDVSVAANRSWAGPALVCFGAVCGSLATYVVAIPGGGKQLASSTLGKQTEDRAVNVSLPNNGGGISRKQATALLDSVPLQANKPRMPLWARSSSALQKLLTSGSAKLVSNAPEVFVVPDFLSVDECDGLLRLRNHMEMAEQQKPQWCFHIGATPYNLTKKTYPGLWGSEKSNKRNKQSDTVCFDEDVGKNVRDDYAASAAVSDSVLIIKGEKPEVDAVEAKAHDMLGLHRDVAYHTQLLKYVPGEKYHEHTDCDKNVPDPTEHPNRIGTLLVMIEEPEGGGETEFPKLGLSLRLARGTAVVFENLDGRDSSCDVRSAHVAAEVTKGQKTILQRWYYSVWMPSPATESYRVYCDASSNCRGYIYSSEHRKADELYHKGLAYYEKHQDQKAMKLFRKALQQEPTNTDVLFKLGEALANNGDLDGGISEMKLGLQHAGGNTQVWFVMARMMDAAGRKDEAIEALRKTIELAPFTIRSEGENFAEQARHMLRDLGAPAAAAPPRQKKTQQKQQPRPPSSQAARRKGTWGSDWSMQ